MALLISIYVLGRDGSISCQVHISNTRKREKKETTMKETIEPIL